MLQVFGCIKMKFTDRETVVRRETHARLLWVEVLERLTYAPGSAADHVNAKFIIGLVVNSQCSEQIHLATLESGGHAEIHFFMKWMDA